MSYIKDSFMSDTLANMFDSIDGENDIDSKMLFLSKASEKMSERLSKSFKKVCYEAKMKDIPTDLIAVKLGISQRAVIRFIRAYSTENKVFNPLDTVDLDFVFDIRKSF